MKKNSEWKHVPPKDFTAEKKRFDVVLNVWKRPQKNYGKKIPFWIFAGNLRENWEKNKPWKMILPPKRKDLTWFWTFRIIRKKTTGKRFRFGFLLETCGKTRRKTSLGKWFCRRKKTFLHGFYVTTSAERKTRKQTFTPLLAGKENHGNAFYREICGKISCNSKTFCKDSEPSKNSRI